MHIPLPQLSRNLFAVAGLRRWILVCVLVWGTTLFTAGAASVSLRPTADTTLFEPTPNNNLGASDLAAGTTAKGLKTRALIYFDVAAALPANATVTSVQLALRVTKAPPSAVASVFGLHRVLQDWGEGDKTGLTGEGATEGEATWNFRFVPSTRWSATGAVAPGDYVATASGTRQIAGVANYTFASTSGLVADVQAWLNDPASNFGWILISQSERNARTARRFGSREEEAVAPVLTIEYSDAPAAVKPSITAGPQSQTVQAGAGVTFQVTATGTEPLAYQWKFNNAPITGATASSLVLQSVGEANAGAYVVTVSNTAGAVDSAPATLTVTPAPGTGKRWTILVYGHADHNLSQSLVVDMQEMEATGSGPDFNVVVQADFDATAEGNAPAGLPAALATGVTRFLVQKDADPAALTSPAVERLPESVNMDDPATLTAFINWAVQRYPADRYGLVLWDHGGQWAGFGGDSQDGTLQDKGILSTVQIRQAVGSAMQTAGIPKWDFVAFDTCLMGGAEVLTDFVPLTDVFIACAEIDYGDGWDYAATLAFLKANPEVSALDFGKAEVQAWEAHHMQPGKESDLELAAHGLYDLTKYAAFEQQFIHFGGLLNEAATLRTSVLPRLRQETTQYSLNGVKEIGQPTDYIDLGELADRLIAEPTVDPALKGAAQTMVASIDAMVVAKVRGTRKQRTHGLSVYYPVPGSKDNAGYLGLSLSTKPGSTWSQYLAAVAGDRAADTAAPQVEAEPEATSAAQPATVRPASYSASVSQPARIPVNVVSGTDAYGLYASIVNQRAGAQGDEFVYLGEVSNSVIPGVGAYTVTWNATLPMLSGPGAAAPVPLGAFYEDIGSDILVSYADYLPPNSTDADLVILLARVKDGQGAIIGALDGEEDDEGLAPQGVDLLPGGMLTPVYYLERRTGDDPSKWEGDATTAASGVPIPANGLAGLVVTLAPVPDGAYSMEVQVVDFFRNESEVLTYAIEVGTATGGVRLEIQAGATGQVVVSWPVSATGYVLEANNVAAASGWTVVPESSIVTDGAVRRFTDNASAQARYYRLRRN